MVRILALSCVLWFASSAIAVPPPLISHVGDAIDPYNHAHFPVRVRSFDEIAWRFSAGKHQGMATPSPDGSLVIQSGAGGLHGLDPDTGKSLWHDSGNKRYWNYSTSVMGLDGVSYGGNHSWIRAVDRNGKRLWKTHLQCGWIHRPPAVSPDGKTIYSGGDQLGVAALDAATGRVNWMRRDFKSPWNQYLFNASGHVIVSTRDRLLCFDARGTELWSHEERLVDLVFLEDTFIGVRGKLIHCLDATKPGTLWTRDPGAKVIGLAVTDTRRLMVALQDGRMLSLDKAGQVRWDKQIADVALHRPITTLGGETLVADAAGILYLLDSNGDVVSHIATGGAPYRWRPTVSPSGNVYFSQADTLVCVTGKERAAPPPMVASHLDVTAASFVVEVWVNGHKLDRGARQLINSDAGATSERIHVDLEAGDWIVFHVVANPFDHVPPYLWVRGVAPDGTTAFASNTQKHWTCCDDPSGAAKFIADPDAPGAGPVIGVAPRFQQFLLDDSADTQADEPVWGGQPSTWIKYVVGTLPAEPLKDPK